MTDETKHTPGEWKYGVRKDKSMWLSLGNHSKGPHYLGDFVGREADAKLVCAAPDMLKALHKIDRHLSILLGNIHGSEKVDPRWEGMKEIVNGWRADISVVIEKAEGRSQ